MPKKMIGFLRDSAGAPQVGVSVSLTHQGGGLVPASDPIWKTGANPVTTDANGMFTFTSELVPGPVYASATVGGQTRYRDSREQFITDDNFMGDLDVIGSLFTDGYVNTPISVTPSGTRQLIIGVGACVIAGYVFGPLETTRTLTGGANATLANRYDYVVFQQHLSGSPTPGRQSIALVQGTVNATFPTINADPNIRELAIAWCTLPLNATSYSITMLNPEAGALGLSDKVGYYTSYDAIEFTIGDGVNPVPTGYTDQFAIVPFDCDVDSWYVLRESEDTGSVPTGTITIDISQRAYVSFPAAGNMITGLDVKPNVSADTKGSGNATGWTPLSRGAILRPNVTTSSGSVNKWKLVLRTKRIIA